MLSSGGIILSDRPEQQPSLLGAGFRAVFEEELVRRKVQLIEASGNKVERLVHHNTLQRMLERGPNRFVVKPLGGVSDIDLLYGELANFHETLDAIKRSVALCQDSRDGFKTTPMLLLGSPGVGKTHFARRVAELLGTGMNLVPMSSTTAGWLLSGSSSQWKGAKPGRVFETLINGDYANPVIVVDEIDKASAKAQYDPIGALYSLLEHDTAESFVDEFAEVPIDASQVIWIMTANDEGSIPKPILNRMDVFEIPSPTPEQARQIAKRMYVEMRSEYGWGARFDPEPSDDVLDRLIQIVPREMRRILKRAFGNAKVYNRYTLIPDDIIKNRSFRNAAGFLQ